VFGRVRPVSLGSKVTMSNWLSYDATKLIVSAGLLLATFLLIARQLEKRSPIDPPRRSEILMDYKLAGANTLLIKLLGPLTAVCSALVLNATGAGYIKLPAHGLWWPASLIVLVLIHDLYRYWLHRLQHAIPVLWALHSFHHSAEALTVVTGARHYWLLAAIELAVMPVFVILFEVPPSMGLLIGLIYAFPDGCSHLNYRIDLGRFVTWLNNPQWHRIHHSVQPEHANKNFCSLLPLFDVIFGTAWVPARDEYPISGLTPRESPKFWEGMLWPLRSHLFRRDRESRRSP
jgi:sterol desaturase/sphingolipid hydroxylase (fatty acid hydroxylase superfamily)